jgi:hypothetical protein
MNPVTDAERLGWQRRTVGVLAELLHRAHTDGLPLLVWTVEPSLWLVGRATRRTAWTVWSQALDLRRSEEARGLDGTTHLSAVGEYRAGDQLRVLVTLLADLPEHDIDDPTDDGGSGR